MTNLNQAKAEIKIPSRNHPAITWGVRTFKVTLLSTKEKSEAMNERMNGFDALFRFPQTYPPRSTKSSDCRRVKRQAQEEEEEEEKPWECLVSRLGARKS